MTDYKEFAKQIKEKYPQFKDVEDLKLAQAMIEKYPQYKDKVTFEQPKQEKPKGIDLTPSGLVKQATAGLAAPLRAARFNETLPEAYNRAREIQENSALNKLSPAVDIAAGFALPEVKAIQGAGLLPRIGNYALTGMEQGAVYGGLGGLKENGLRGLLPGVGEGAVAGGLIGGGLPLVGNAVKNIAQNPMVQNTATKVIEGLTSVPKKFADLALRKELSGNSLFSGSFNPEIAYQPIEQQVRNAKNMFPTATDFGNQYYELGQQALEGMNKLKANAGEKINEALGKLENKELKNGGIQAAVNSVINKYGKGGVYNSARKQAPGVVKFLDEELNKEGLTLIDLHRIKEDLYNMGYALAGSKQGRAAEVARGAAEQINNYLRGVSSNYAKPNDAYSLIMDVTRGLDGSTTMGNKLSEIGSVNSAKSGIDARLKAVDNLLPQQNKFYKKAQDLINNENEVNNIINTIGQQYERNPRLLANRFDTKFENALEDLQKKTGTNFMQDLEEIRAREAFEKLAPGQGGGSGNTEGFMNNVVRPILMSAPKTVSAAVLGNIFGGPFGAALGLGMVSPRIMGKGLIKTLGKMSRYQSPSPKSLVPIQYGVQRLYGGISND